MFSYKILDEFKNLNPTDLLNSFSIEQIYSEFELLKKLDDINFKMIDTFELDTLKALSLYELETFNRCSSWVIEDLLSNDFELEELIENIDYLKEIFDVDCELLEDSYFRDDYTNKEILELYSQERVISLYNEYDCWDCMTIEDCGAYSICLEHETSWAELSEEITDNVDLYDVGLEWLRNEFEGFYSTGNRMYGIDKK